MEIGMAEEDTWEQYWREEDEWWFEEGPGAVNGILDRSNTQCYNCGKYGHMAKGCTAKGKGKGGNATKGGKKGKKGKSKNGEKEKTGQKGLGRKGVPIDNIRPVDTLSTCVEPRISMTEAKSTFLSSVQSKNNNYFVDKK